MMSSSSPSPGRGGLGRRYAGLGARRIWWGIVILVGIQLAVDLGETVGGFTHHPEPELVLTAWAVVIVADLAVIVVTRVLGDHLPNWMFGLFVGALAVGLVLDLAAATSQSEPGFSISVGRSATLSLLLALTTRPARELVAAALGFTLVTAIGMAINGAFEPATRQHAIFTLSQMALTIAVAAIAISGFRDLVRRELERARSRAALLAPRVTVGIDQSEQLARLDLAAESLLAAVAEGRVQLPLNEEIARRAGALATDLRLHLLESRSRTWLDLAIEESELLAAAVRVEDPTVSAGLLSPTQRGALLSALWLLAEARPARRDASAAIVTFERPVQVGFAPSVYVLPVTVQLRHARRSGFDAGVWQHFAQVGDYREVHDHAALRVEIRATVPVSALGVPLDR